LSPAVGKLPSVLGSGAALVVAFLGYTAQVSPATCAVRVVTAFVVFCAFGVVIRYLLSEAASRHEEAAAPQVNDAIASIVAHATEAAEQAE
jgi:hypothetical protein